MQRMRRCRVCEDATMECIRSRDIRFGIVENRYECRSCSQTIDVLNRWGYALWLAMTVLIVGGTVYAMASGKGNPEDNVYIALFVAGLVTVFGVMLGRRWLADRRNPEVGGTGT
jgi:hypothetical protein